MKNITERLDLKENKRQISECSFNSSFSSNNSFYENLSIEIKKDIIFLIKSGYDKKMIIKLYIFLKPSNINEAIHYLTKENGIYQHIFYSSIKNKDSCEICGEKGNIHISHIDNSFSSASFNKNIYSKNEREDIIKIKTFQKNYICKICEEEILEKENINECKLCYNNFCNDCLYSYIKETIRNGKYIIKCPDSDCDCILTKVIIDKILSFNNSNDFEVNNLKKLIEKNKTKEVVLSNPDLMFCPIVNCEGYCNKKTNKNYNVCNMGHKFCPICGELYHKDGKCKEEEKVDELFEQYYKKYKLKKCPYCQIITSKNGGTCLYCHKNWCWLCNELFETTEEHYGNRESKCYKRMMGINQNNNLLICSKCGNETNNYLIFFRCRHIICNECFGNHLLQNNYLFIFPDKVMKCIISDCINFRLYEINTLIRFIRESNNEDVIKKYRSHFLISEYFILPFNAEEFGDYLEDIGKLFFLLLDYIENKILKIIIHTIIIIIFLIFLVAIPIFPHFVIKKLYYFKLKEEINNKILLSIIILGEELLFLKREFLHQKESILIKFYYYALLFLE